jgi:hypothetical protein
MTDNKLTALKEAADFFEIQIVPAISLEEGKKLLANKINTLIESHFKQLVNILYRLDINEIKLRQVLRENTDKDAGDLIAQLVIERQLVKINTRQQFRASTDNESEEEKW